MRSQALFDRKVAKIVFNVVFYTALATLVLYIMINGQDNKIIGSLGEIDNRVQNVDTKIVMDRKSNTYYESDKKINLTENGNLKQVQDRYDALKNAYEKEIEQEKEDER